MSRVTDELRDHSFDDIQEYDNPLPGWWLGIFWVTIAFGVVYAPWVHFGDGNTIHDEYDAEVAAAVASYGTPEAAAVFDNDEMKARCAKGEWQARAEDTFAKNCLACHRADGGGLVGPNFTDDFYLHGGRPADLAKTITLGVPEKGMIAWGKIIDRQTILDLACKVRAFRGTTPGNEPMPPKAPQGVQVDVEGIPLP